MAGHGRGRWPVGVRVTLGLWVVLLAGLVAWLTLTSVTARGVDCGNVWTARGDAVPTDEAWAAAMRAAEARPSRLPPDASRVDRALELQVFAADVVDGPWELSPCHRAGVDRLIVAGWVAGVGLVAVGASAVVWRRRPV